MQAAKRPVLYIFFGLIASGKSTLAEAFARRYDFPCYNTDRVRKELAGIDPATRQPDQFNQGIYTRDFSRKTYQAMLDRASADIGSGSRGVVLDGSYSSRDERARVIELCDGIDARCFFIQCQCREDVVRERLALRTRDPKAVSDGRWEIYLVQKQKFEAPSELDASMLVTVNTDRPIALMVEKLATALDIQ